jgi:hypothetical protein
LSQPHFNYFIQTLLLSDLPNDDGLGRLFMLAWMSIVIYSLVVVSFFPELFRKYLMWHKSSNQKFFWFLDQKMLDSINFHYDLKINIWIARIILSFCFIWGLLILFLENI